MKKSYLNIVWALAFPLVMGSCSEEDFGGADGNIPSVEDIADAVSVTVDQSTNQVTFEVNESALVGKFAVWTFGPGATSAANSSTSSKVTRTYESRGDYSVSVQLANKDGISDGVINKTFHIDRNLVKSDQVSALTSDVLYWYYVANDHFGCGEPNLLDNLDRYGLNWWSCSAFGKSDSGMYDDSFTFVANNTSGTEITGSFTYDPGEDGMIHVNSGVTFEPFGSYNTGADFDAPVQKQTSTWKLYYDEQDVLWLEFAPKTMVGYIPNEDCWNAPKFRVLELGGSKISMVTDNGGISWRYVFCSQALNEVDDIGGSNYAEAIIGTWMLNTSEQGHLGCGPSVEDALSWWSCGPNEKDGFGVYDDIITFTEDEYTFDPGEGEDIYVNWGCTYDPALHAAATETQADYVAAAEKQTTSYEIVAEGGAYYLVLPANTLMSYLADDSMYANPKFKINRISKDKNTLELRTVQSGISWNYIFKRIEE